MALDPRGTMHPAPERITRVTKRLCDSLKDRNMRGTKKHNTRSPKHANNRDVFGAPETHLELRAHGFGADFREHNKKRLLLSGQQHAAVREHASHYLSVFLRAAPFGIRCAAALGYALGWGYSAIGIHSTRHRLTPRRHRVGPRTVVGRGVGMKEIAGASVSRVVARRRCPGRKRRRCGVEWGG